MIVRTRGVGDFDESDGGVTPSPSSSSSAGPAIDWSRILNTAVGAASNIFTARFAVPPPGTSIQTAQGSIFRPLPGQQLPLSLGGGSSLMTWVLIGGAVIAGVAVLSKGRG